MTTAEEHSQYLAVSAALEARGFSRMNFDMNRIKALLEVMGDPQKSFRAIHITGTNGKTSTARIVESLLRAHGLRTGRYTSPHLDSVRERISVDGEPVSEERFTALYRELAPLAELVDARFDESMTYFEMTTALAFAAFADAPVDVAVVEVGLGGEEDATNVLGAEVAVVTPIGVDHTRWLGETLTDIATAKAGIIHPGSNLVTATQEPEAMIPLVERCHAVKAGLIAQGRSFDVADRKVALGGQQLALQGPSGSVYDGVFLPLHGKHQAQNAAVALAATEVLLGAGTPKTLDGEVVAEGLAEVTSPGRLERVRTAPVVLLDGAHNPAGMAATVAAVEEEFSLRRLIVVLGVFGDKNAVEMLRLLQPVCDHLVVTQSTSERAKPVAALAREAAEVFDDEQITVMPYLPDAIESAVTLAEEGEAAYGGAGVLITGSVHMVGDARKLLVRT
ncbi:bifunctional folylpolyglutamate synthase/dihydrofolate synthase [Stackebrandtia nassauensis]|uniref:tetrahydrofolate synthase n=1 Tax=Stackebrandtia nassauensis (strain DSM 44728 / CIP 108903 / NRRL B-16338 / NBRC 102104 / LLR-40K-21) TaxID=446470 RepID=D3QB52_STANL|nr:folylpolyglutamate synthase/dihydrofolate synthase family protein [Stackebrandtia nassauensis]ADD40869.1 FolC bifunctional protein [Stackebrandtia nassauensis DSM 44728]